MVPSRRRREREPGVRELPKSCGRDSREIGVDDERVSVDAGETCSDRSAEARTGIDDDLGARRHDRRIVRDHENTPDRQCRFHDVSEHRHGQRRAHRGREAPLRVSAIRDHDGRHAAKRTQAAFEDVLSAPGPEVAHSRTSNQCVPRSASATSRSVWPGLKTWWSRSQQISTSSSEACEMRAQRLGRELSLGDRVVLELEVGVELHQLRPVRAGARAHRVAEFSSSIHVPSKRTTPRTSSPG